MRKSSLLVALAFSFWCLPALAGDCGSEARAWLDAHLQAPAQSLDEISQVPLIYRRAAFQKLAPEVKAQMWQAQLLAFLEVNRDLDTSQQDLVFKALKLAEASVFQAEESKLASFRAEAEALREDFLKSFGAETTKSVLGELGPRDSEIVLLGNGDVSHYLPPGDGSGGGIKCSCADSSSYCGSGYHCELGGCTTTSGGCGTLWLYDCDGLCKQRPE